MSFGPVALPFFIFLAAASTSLVVVGGTGPGMGLVLWIGWWGNSTLQISEKYFEDGGWVMEDLVVGILDMFDLANVLRCLMAISGEAVDFVRSSGHVQSFIELVIV